MLLLILDIIVLQSNHMDHSDTKGVGGRGIELNNNSIVKTTGNYTSHMSVPDKFLRRA